MSAAVHFLHADQKTAAERKRDRLRRILESCRISLVSQSLYKLQVEDVRGRRVIYYPNRFAAPFCILGRQAESLLLGDAPMSEVPMRMTCFRSAAISIPPILDSTGIDAVRINYCRQDIAVAVNINYLIDRITR